MDLLSPTIGVKWTADGSVSAATSYYEQDFWYENRTILN